MSVRSDSPEGNKGFNVQQVNYYLYELSVAATAAANAVCVGKHAANNNNNNNNNSFLLVLEHLHAPHTESLRHSLHSTLRHT